MPPAILALFAPRPPLQYKTPPDKDKQPWPQYTGVSSFLRYFKDPKDLKPLPKHPTPLERRALKRERKLKRNQKRIAVQTRKCIIFFNFPL